MYLLRDAPSFTARYLGQHVTAPGGLGGQCVDWANLWLGALGLSPVRLNAADWKNAHIAGWAWTPNTPTNFPPVGALVVWGPWPALSVGAFGHIALVLAADANTLITADQNWPGGAPVQIVCHHYGGIAGWQCGR